jgi:predicted amidophosphoribosyltransferase
VDSNKEIVLEVHGFHTDCSACKDRLQSPDSTPCSNCGEKFTHVRTEYLYKIGKPEVYETIKKWKSRA